MPRHRPHGDDYPAIHSTAFATVSSLKRFNCGSRILASATVSAMVKSNGSPMPFTVLADKSDIELCIVCHHDGSLAELHEFGQDLLNRGRIEHHVILDGRSAAQYYTGSAPPD